MFASSLPELYGRTGAILCALIVTASILGLTMHKDFYAGIHRRDFFCFYTNLSNLLVLIYFALISPRLHASRRLHALVPHADFFVMMSIMLTFCVFHLMLYPAIRKAVRHAAPTREFRIAFTDNLIIHYLVPWLVFAYWLLCSPQKALLSLADAFIWTIFPLSYLLCIFLRAKSGRRIEETDSPYPYPFLDKEVLGVRFVARTCLSLYGVCVLAGAAVVFLVRLLFALRDGTHMLLRL